MDSYQKNQIKLGCMFWDGETDYYRIVHYIFSDLTTYQFGAPVEDNIVHVHIFHAPDFINPVGHKDFLHIKFLQPVLITPQLLTAVGFHQTQLKGMNVLRNQNAHISDINSIAGVFTIKKVTTDEPFGTQYIHQAQLVAIT